MTDRDNVIHAVTAYVERVHAGSWEAAFAATDTDGDGRVDAENIKELLKRAGIGYSFTRGTIARAIVREVDMNGDGFVTEAELLQAFQGPNP